MNRATVLVGAGLAHTVVVQPFGRGAARAVAARLKPGLTHFTRPLDEHAERIEESGLGQAARKRLSFKEQRELDALPARLEALEAEQRALAEKIAGPDFYKEAAAAIKASLERVEQLQRELVAVYTRWDELESRRQ